MKNVNELPHFKDCRTKDSIQIGSNVKFYFVQVDLEAVVKGMLEVGPPGWTTPPEL